MVDEVLVGPTGQVGDAGPRHDHVGELGQSVEADHYGALAHADGLVSARRRHGDDALIGAVVLGPAGYVARRAVVVQGDDAELLLKPLGAGPMGRLDVKGREFGRGGRRPGRAAGDPAHENAMIDGAGREPLSAAVRNGPRRFQHEQTLGRIGAVDPPAEAIADDR